MERGHRTLTVVPKGGKTVTAPLAPRTARAVDLAVGERAAGPIFIATGGHRLDRHGAARIVRRVARRAGIVKPIGPHTLRHAFITAALNAGVPLRPEPARQERKDRRIWRCCRTPTKTCAGARWKDLLRSGTDRNSKHPTARSVPG